MKEHNKALNIEFNSAIVGCGAISSVHAEAISDCVNTKLYAVCDIDIEKAKAAADKYQCMKYCDFDELLEDRAIDVIHVCTPHYLHAPMAIKAMKAGKHVLLEKPMALTEEDALDIISVSQKTGKRVGVCFQNRYNETSVKLKELLASGSCGRLLGGKAFVTWHRDERYYSSGEWRGTWDKEGGGVLINQAIHTLDLLQWFIGEVASLKASMDTRLLEKVIEVEDTIDATIKFSNGANALFYATNCYCTDSPVEIELVCQDAIIQLKDSLTISYKSGKTERYENLNKATGEKAYWGCSHKLLINDYYSKLKKGEPFLLDGEVGMKAVRLVNGFYKSAKENEYVSFI